MKLQLGLLALVSFFPTWAAAQLPSIHSVVSLSYHHYSTDGRPEWVFVGRARAPRRFRELQAARPNGCTVTGQARALIANEASTRRRFTFVGTSIVEAVSRRSATVGVVTPGGTQWWQAFEVPTIAATPMGREVVAFDGRLYGFTVEAVVSEERAEAASFRGCGRGAISIARDRDGFLHCFANASVTSTWTTTSNPGADRLASYESTYRSQSGRRRVVGRFVRLLSGRAGRILIVDDGTSVHAHSFR